MTPGVKIQIIRIQQESEYLGSEQKLPMFRRFLHAFRSIIRPQLFDLEYETGKGGEQGHRAKNDGQSRPGLVPGDPHGGKEIQ